MLKDERGLVRRDGPPWRTVWSALPSRVAERPDRGEGGFTLIEMMISAALTMVVVGAAVALATTVQNVYSYELDDAAVQQEARFALDWISRTIATGGSNPYDIGDPALGAAIDQELSCTPMEPGFVLGATSIQVLSDVYRPNGLLGGEDGDCVEPGEDVTIAFNADGQTITRLDPAIDLSGAAAMTDSVVSGLTFTYLNSNRVVTADPDSVVYVQVSVTVQSKSRNPYTGNYTTYSYDTEVRVRSR